MSPTAAKPVKKSGRFSRIGIFLLVPTVWYSLDLHNYFRWLLSWAPKMKKVVKKMTGFLTSLAAVGLIFRRRMSISSLSPENEPHRCETGQKIGSFFTHRYFSSCANRVIFSRSPQSLSLVTELSTEDKKVEKNNDRIFDRFSIFGAHFPATNVNFWVVARKWAPPLGNRSKNRVIFHAPSFTFPTYGSRIIKVSGAGLIFRR